MRKALLGVALALWLAPTAHASVRTRIVYASGWSGSMELYAVDPSTRGPLGQLTTGTEPDCAPTAVPCGFIDPIPSPDGRRILFRGATWGLGSYRMGVSSLWVARANGANRLRLVATRNPSTGDSGLEGAPAWSPDSRKIAYATSGDIHIVDADGRDDRVFAPGIAGDLAWSRDGRSLFVLASSDLYVVRNGKATKIITGSSCRFNRFALSPDARWVATTCLDGRIRLIPVSGRARPERVLGRGIQPVWSPDGRRLAFQAAAGIAVYQLKTRSTRLLTHEPLTFDPAADGTGLAWSPDGRSLAYVRGSMQTFADTSVSNGDLRVVTLAGRVHTVVSRAARYGGRIVGVAWTRSSAAMRYPRPEPVPSGIATKDSLLADGPIEHLAADGSRVAFVACDQISTWTPGATAETTRTLGGCGDRDRYSIYDLALAGDRLLYAEMIGCNSITQDLSLRSVDPGVAPIRLARGQGACGGPFNAVGRLLGSGNFLAFSNWQEVGDYTSAAFTFTTVAQSVSRVEPNGCPCPVLASSPGPLLPADVDAGRLIVYGTNETEMFDANGVKLLSLRISASAAQLTGSDLILFLQGELRDFDADTGVLRHTWVLPNVWTGPSCSFHCGATANCWYTCGQYPLAVQDAARGLVSYTLSGDVHVLRLSDGLDRVVGKGTLARFMDSGLVYANGARLQLVPFSGLRQ